MTLPARVPPDIEGALDALPLFPLPQAVLFPGAVMPLHVFEPRYKTMIRDCLASHRTLSVVHISDAEARDARGQPAIASVAGVGIIVDHAELPDGRYNILVRGRARVRIEELPFIPPYRTGRATVLVAEDTGVPERDVTALMANATAFVALVRERDPEFDFRIPSGASPGFVADVCAHHLVIDADERQTILETLGLSERVRHVTEALALQRLALSNKAHDLN